MIVGRFLLLLALGLGTSCSSSDTSAPNPSDAAPRTGSATAPDVVASPELLDSSDTGSCREEFEGDTFIDGWPVVAEVDVAGVALQVVEQVGDTVSTVAFLAGDDCPFARITHDDDPEGRFGWYAGGISCVPDCGVGLVCTADGIASMEWKAVVPGPDGTDLSLAEILRDRDLTVDDVVVRTARRTWRLDGTQWSAVTQPVIDVVPLGDASLATFNEGLLCDGQEFGTFGAPASRQDIIDFLELRTFDA